VDVEKMYTTSRYTQTKTRELAKRLAKENNEQYVARGKKTIYQLVAYARRKGHDTIKIIEDNEKIATIEVDELGHWKWKRGD
jgi:rRNA maturation protein Rpf1